MILKELPIGEKIVDKKTKFNGKPIEWLVADHEKYPDGTVLLSEDILCCRPFDEPKEYYWNKYQKIYGSNRWMESDIRKWLNDDFFCKSFSGRLADLTICASKSTAYPRLDRDSSMIYVGDSTEEDVFLLSDAEIGYEEDCKALELFKGDNKEKYRIAEVRPGLTWYWWLRSPCAGYSYSARYVNTDGSLNDDFAYYGYGGVRPACVIFNSAPVEKRKNGEYKFNWKR